MLIGGWCFLSPNKYLTGPQLTPPRTHVPVKVLSKTSLSTGQCCMCMAHHGSVWRWWEATSSVCGMPHKLRRAMLLNDQTFNPNIKRRMENDSKLPDRSSWGIALPTKACMPKPTDIFKLTSLPCLQLDWEKKETTWLWKSYCSNCQIFHSCVNKNYKQFWERWSSYNKFQGV